MTFLTLTIFILIWEHLWEILRPSASAPTPRFLIGRTESAWQTETLPVLTGSTRSTKNDVYVESRSEPAALLKGSCSRRESTRHKVQTQTITHALLALHLYRYTMTTALDVPLEATSHHISRTRSSRRLKLSARMTDLRYTFWPNFMTSGL